VVARQHQDRNVGGEFGFDLLILPDLSVVGEVAADEDRVESSAAKVAHDPPGAGQRPCATVEVGVADVRDDHHAESISRAMRWVKSQSVSSGTPRCGIAQPSAAASGHA
jgi:hypothetical protein